ncbi:bile acid:sodium symporter family protein [Candidatus Collinsella stercoripullorum]|uniref:bile acid:sodium symporter family protein n=1 Tax=Candidatus Collinsella stercoripullorum TaxID=2838522 RepID=UPI0022E084F8|nr:bile acid:sodium symporter family protein [Candidatus Collinsella stercoripullorum]
MEQWKRLGAFIGKHMAYFVPLCVVAGVLLPGVFGPLKAIVPLIFAVMTFQGALNNTFEQLLAVFRHPLRLLVILAVAEVLMPCLAYLLGSLLFGDNVNLLTGVVLEYSVPIAVISFMWVGIYDGDGPLCLASILVSTVISPVSIPVTLSVLLGASIHIDAMSMVGDMVAMIALPALAGMLVNELTRGWGHERLSPVLSPASRLITIVLITVNSTSMSEYVLNMTWERLEVALFILVFATSGFFWGLLAARILHGSQPLLATMSFTCGMRNISSGAVIAAQYFPGETVFPVMCGTLFQQILAATFGHIIERLCADQREQGERRVKEARRLLASRGRR